MAEAAVWDVERMRPIVAEWDEALRAELPAYKRLVPAAEARGSLLRPQAAPEAVVAAEARLGARFPPSYRSFLLIADGADAGARAPSYVLRGLGEIEQRLLGAEEVAAFSDDDNLVWLVDMWQGNLQEFADRQEVPAEEPVQVFDFAPGVNALLITVPVQDGIVGLVPFDPEWQVWEFFWDEVRAHRSFADFLSFSARASRQTVAERVERIRSIDVAGAGWIEATTLADHGDPRAVGVACTRLLDTRESYGSKERMARLLGWLGDPRAIPALRTAASRVDDPGFATPVEGMTPHGVEQDHQRLRFTLLQSLDLCGDAAVVGDLKRLAQGAPPTSGFAARYLKSRESLPRW